MSGADRTNTSILNTNTLGAIEYELHSNENFYLIRIFKSLEEESYNTLTDRIKALIVDRPEHFIIDCKNLNELPLLWPRFLVQLAKTLAIEHRKVNVTNVNEKFKSTLKESGLDSAFSPTLNISEALVLLKISKPGAPKLDVTIVNPFILASVRTIEAQTKISPLAGKIYSRESGAEFAGEVNGIIPLNSANFQGFVIISFSKKLAIALSRLILDEVANEINDTIKSSVAEITNIVFISGKRKLNEIGYAVDSALPKVLVGTNIPTEISQKSSVILTVPFETPEGAFYVEVRMS